MQHERILPYFAKYIESELGIVYAEHNYFQLQNRLEEIAKLLSVESLEKLFKLAETGITGQFKQLLLDLATNNETSFFRDIKVFKAIENLVLPGFLQNEPSGAEMRIWSGASSTGQEALSLSILITEWNLKAAKPIRFSILGTDISERILLRAKKAEYSQLEVQRGLPTPYLLKYFQKNDQDRWTASPSITKPVEFRKQNLLDPFDFAGKFHLILLRNVLIYQPLPNKIEILKRVTEKLAPGGMLILGSGESLLGLSSDYSQTAYEGAVVYLKKGAGLSAA
jgi:chemotaxis protein methyltransferase CheR